MSRVFDYLQVNQSLWFTLRGTGFTYVAPNLNIQDTFNNVQVFTSANSLITIDYRSLGNLSTPNISLGNSITFVGNLGANIVSSTNNLILSINNTPLQTWTSSFSQVNVPLRWVTSEGSGGDNFLIGQNTLAANLETMAVSNLIPSFPGNGIITYTSRIVNVANGLANSYLVANTVGNVEWSSSLWTVFSNISTGGIFYFSLTPSAIRRPLATLEIVSTNNNQFTTYLLNGNTVVEYTGPQTRTFFCDFCTYYGSTTTTVGTLSQDVAWFHLHKNLVALDQTANCAGTIGVNYGVNGSATGLTGPSATFSTLISLAPLDNLIVQISFPPAHTRTVRVFYPTLNLRAV